MVQGFKKINFIQRKLIDWYTQNRRDLPWRKEPVNPYHVLISEVMLQQTTVATVMGYFFKFVDRWPAIIDLADATQDELMHCWQGLGYYSRARNLHKTAKIIAHEYNGIVPNSYQQLVKFPGIGPYTAAAIAGIAFKQAIIAIDTNVKRVLCRLFLITSKGQQQQSDVQIIANYLAHPTASGDLSQALMDLGSSLCKSKNPRCADCFLKKDCAAFANTLQHSIPFKPEKPDRPKRYGHTYVMRHGAKICIEKRPEKGLLAGLYQFPSSEFSSAQTSPEFPFTAQWQNVGSVRHIFSHFELELTIWEVFVTNTNRGIWVEIKNLKDYGFPTMYKKALSYIK